MAVREKFSVLGRLGLMQTCIAFATLTRMEWLLTQNHDGTGLYDAIWTWATAIVAYPPQSNKIYTFDGNSLLHFFMACCKGTRSNK
jgi:hypothetical protein